MTDIKVEIRDAGRYHCLALIVANRLGVNTEVAVPHGAGEALSVIRLVALSAIARYGLGFPRRQFEYVRAVVLLTWSWAVLDRLSRCVIDAPASVRFAIEPIYDLAVQTLRIRR
jgi:hypothetical protein